MLDQVARRFRCLGEPFRLRILKVLSGGEKTVGELVERLHGNQPNVSKHLQMLYAGGLISRRREGVFIFYAIKDSVVFTLCDLVCRTVAAKSREDAATLGWPRRPAAARTRATRRKAQAAPHAL